MSKKEKSPHEVVFTTYPKLLFIWPIILLGFLLYPFGRPPRVEAGPDTTPPAAAATEAAPAESADAETAAEDGASAPRPGYSQRLETLGWIYLWVVVLVGIGVDVDRNMAIFWIVLVALLIFLGLWLRDTRQFTLFGDIYRWFDNLDLRYNRNAGLALSIVMLVPYLVMLLWARFNSRWRITHNEFEHYAFGKMDDSLGRGAKTIRTNFPDIFEFILGFGAGTLIVFNATGTRELRRIPHVMFLPMVRKRLNQILETTAVTAAQLEEEEEDEDL
jgi:hypothetical protein